MPVAAPPRMVTEVGEAGVPGDRLALAARFLPLFVADLGLAADTRIAWFRPESEVAKSMRLAGQVIRARLPIPDCDEHLAGFVNPKAHTVLWLRADAEPEDLLETMAHEAMHAQFVGRVLAGEVANRDDEPEADAFGKRVAAAARTTPREPIKGVMEMLSQKSATAPALSHKTVPFRALALKASTSGWSVTGYASVFNSPTDPSSEADSYGDLVLRGAFARTIQERKTKLYLEHHTLIGHQLELKEDDHGLLGTWAIAPTADGTDAHTLLLSGTLDQMSIGYFVRDSEMRSDGVRLLKDVELFECSLVGIPAQPRAVVTAAKHGAGRPGGERIVVGVELHRRKMARIKRIIEGRESRRVTV